MHSWIMFTGRQTYTRCLFPICHSFHLKAAYCISGTVCYHVICAIIQKVAKLSPPLSLLSSEKQRHPIHHFEKPILHFSRSSLGIKWHMADESLWYLFLAPCIMFFIVPNFQQLDLINPGKTQWAQGGLNNWSDWACSLAASLPNIQGNHNKIENNVCPCLLVCL